MIDNPLPSYYNNDKRNHRIQSFIENNVAMEGSSGLTLGLILKEYSEFQVDAITTIILEHR